MSVPSSLCSSIPIEDASIAQYPNPFSKYSRNFLCKSTGSGVVKPVDSTAFGTPIPKVPTIKHLVNDLGLISLTACSACDNHQAVVVLPLVPVIACTFNALAGIFIA